MSLKKWRQRTEAEWEVEKQEQEIRQKFKRKMVENQVGQIEAEKLLKPVTKRLDRDLQASVEEEVEGPDYAMDDEFDRINPFDWDDFRPEDETPPSLPNPRRGRRLFSITTTISS